VSTRSIHRFGWRGLVAALFGCAMVTLVLSSKPAGILAAPDEPAAKAKAEPTAAEKAALEEGQALFRGLCSGCHGGAGRGGKGPDLTRKKFMHGSTDEDIVRTIRNGVPKTTMKKLGDVLKDEQVTKLLLFIRSLQRAPADSTWKPYMAGDAKLGRQIFFDPKSKVSCAKCHTIDGAGGRVGPPLDHLAGRRAPEFIMESILQPSKDIDPQYEAVQVVTKKGIAIIGLRVNESNFSIQLREENGRFHSFDKRDLDEVNVLKKSLMPENIAEQLNVKELHDLFAYLMTLE
jgi:putative heme-binding domain-containing protein